MSKSSIALAVFGVALIIISAVLSNYYTKQRYQRVEQYQQEISQIETIIDQKWQRVQSLEQKADFAAVMLALSSQESYQLSLYGYIENIAKGLNVSMPEGMSGRQLFHWLTKQLSQHKSRVIDSINQRYGEKITLSEKKSQLEKYISELNNLALFLYIVGLSALLIQDLFRGRK